MGSAMNGERVLEKEALCLDIYSGSALVLELQEILDRSLIQVQRVLCTLGSD